MTDATDQPQFEPEGAPVSVLLDFDGTISLDDTGDTLLARLFEDQQLTRHMDDLYMTGEKGSRELIAWDMEVLPRDADALWRSAIGCDVARVVVKRPAKAPALAASSPSHSVGGKSVRYDVYVRRGLG